MFLSPALAILLAILGISVLVIAHESGHYLVARAFKMRVLRFSIGFGPALVRWRPKGSPTTFQICAIPFLAYVQIAGMNPAEDVDPNDPEIYPNKGLFARMMTIFAGPLANYVVAVLMAFGLSLSGLPEAYTLDSMIVDEISIKSPAEKAKLREGDVIVMAAGQPVGNVEDLRRINKNRGRQPTEYVIERNGRRIEVTITPEVGRDGTPILGVVPRMGERMVQLPVGEAALNSLVLPAKITALQIAGIAEMFRTWDSSNLMGPVGMTEQAKKSVDRGASSFIFFLIILSVALGLFNLLPVPALDGGRLVFLAYELIARRRPNERFEAIVHTVGLLFLLVIVALVSVREIGKLI